MLDLPTLLRHFAALANFRLLVVGDVMVDEFIHGEVSRVSPEAPIPVLVRARQATMLGAAGNVARNIASLGSAAVVAGVVGDDPAAETATRLVAAAERLESALVAQAGRPTTLKTRYVAAGQQLLRVDHEDSGAIDAATDAKLAGAIAIAAQGCKAILLSDYGKGCVSEAVIAACRKAAENAGAVLIVDSKAGDFARYGAVDLIKPNAGELSRETGLPTGTDAEVEAALEKALDQSAAKAVMVTRGARGASLGVRGELVRHFPGQPRPVFDVSGAGDTAMAALGVALAAGAGLEDAAELAVLAAGVAVAKPGTAVVIPAELIEALRDIERPSANAKLANAERMAEEAEAWRGHGLKIGFTNGCFDILHRGHVAYLAWARSQCDRLIVGLNSDRSVRALKGEGRPVNDLESRALVLGGLGSVDLVVAFDEDTPVELIKAARPDVLVKGADYSLDGVVGRDLVESWGGQVKLAPLVEGYSTTAAIEKMSRRA